MPGSVTSIPKSGAPFTILRLSTPVIRVPSSVKVLGSLSVTFAGAGSCAALVASAPYVAVRFEAACDTTPFAVVHSLAFTFHSSAAASTSTARAAAPARRIAV